MGGATSAAPPRAHRAGNRGGPRVPNRPTRSASGRKLLRERYTTFVLFLSLRGSRHTALTATRISHEPVRAVSTAAKSSLHVGRVLADMMRRRSRGATQGQARDEIIRPEGCVLRGIFTSGRVSSGSRRRGHCPSLVVRLTARRYTAVRSVAARVVISPIRFSCSATESARFSLTH